MVQFGHVILLSQFDCCENSTYLFTALNLPVLAMATLLGRRAPDPSYNWLSTSDIKNLLQLAGFESITQSGYTLLPAKLPGLNWLANRFLAKMPILNQLCLTWQIVARVRPERKKEQPEYIC